jgi:hypothetical protein
MKILAEFRALILASRSQVLASRYESCKQTIRVKDLHGMAARRLRDFKR